MKLYWSQTCPHSRMTRVTAMEAGLAKEVNFIQVDSDREDFDIRRISPLSSVPVLYLTSHEAYFDSRVICECLNEFGTASLVPGDGPGRWRILRRQAVGLYLMESAISLRNEHILRTDNNAKSGRIPTLSGGIELALKHLNERAEQEGFLLGDIAVLCALELLDEIELTRGWRERHPNLEDWYGRHAERPSVIATRFHHA